MNIDNHIEEMAKTLCGEKHSCKDCPQYTCCGFRIEATALYANDYRKQSEVANEVLNDVLNALQHTRFASPIERSGTLYYIISLKKKYTKGSERCEN